MWVSLSWDQVNKISYKVDIFHAIDWSGICDKGIELYGNQSWTGDVDDHVDITPRYLGNHDALLEVAHDL